MKKLPNKGGGRRYGFFSSGITLSIALAWLSSVSGESSWQERLPALPTAVLMDRLTGSPSHRLYFVGLVIMLPIFITWAWRLVEPHIRQDRRHRLAGALMFAGASGFCLWILLLIPADRKMGGGRFSLMLELASTHWLVLGAIFGVVFLSTAVFAALFALSFKNTTRK